WKDVLEKLDIPGGLGVIIRTSGETARFNDLKADMSNLVRIWRGVEKRFSSSDKPAVIYKEATLAKRFARDYLSDDVTEILVDSRDAHNELMSFVKNAMPSKQNIVKFYDEDMPLFSRFGVERQIEEVFQPRVNLPSGGSIIISPTEALIAIDVNSGRMKEGSAEETAFQTNREAAEEIARQVIIRDLGGLIVVDFIDLENLEHKKAVEAALRSAFREDKARLSFSRIRDFGIMSFTRQRLKPEIQHGFNIKCEHCGGSGHTKSVESSGLACLRKVRERLCQNRSEKVNIYSPVEVTNFLNNARREEITKLEKKYKCRINLVAVEHMMQKDIKIDFLNKNDEDGEIHAKPFEPSGGKQAEERRNEAKGKKK
ncbi:MAG: ribonuclease E/G, partial [Deltaproteobacteria bacterium]|nr:ribonuclease E/G [Deltaproteobacteria bacterium]